MSKLGKTVTNWTTAGARLNERAGLGFLERKISGDETGKTAASQILDPFRKARINSAKGGSLKFADITDPNAKLHSYSTNTDANKEADGAAKVAEGEAARIRSIAPTEDSDAVKEAKRRSLMRQKGRSGRSSTILTGGAPDMLG